MAPGSLNVPVPAVARAIPRVTPGVFESAWERERAAAPQALQWARMGSNRRMALDTAEEALGLPVTPRGHWCG